MILVLDFLLLLRCSLSSLLLSPLSLLCSLPSLTLHMISLPVNFYHTITNAPPALRYAPKNYLKVPRSIAKYYKVPRRTFKYPEGPQSTSKYLEVPQSTYRYLQVPVPMSASLFLFTIQFDPPLMQGPVCDGPHLVGCNHGSRNVLHRLCSNGRLWRATGCSSWIRL